MAKRTGKKAAKKGAKKAKEGKKSVHRKPPVQWRPSLPDRDEGGSGNGDPSEDDDELGPLRGTRD
jgi:hypothetical protein